MGCTDSKEYLQPLSPIPAPQGTPIDPLEQEGDILEKIMVDPHIHFFQRKLKEAFLPLRTKQKMKVQDKQNKEPFKPRSTSSSFHKLPPIALLETFATSDCKQHQKYLKSVNQAIAGNAKSVTNILSFMIQQMADARQQGQVQGKFNNDSYAALKCFIYLYTGRYTYKKINSQLRRSDYQKISFVIAVVKKQLQQYNKQKFARKLKANQKIGKILSLYRGIPKPDKIMIKGVKLYWKGFTSTSLESAVANKFGRYNYVIELENHNPHPYMIVPEQLSQFKEQQIILFPYFYFECTSVEDFTSGAKYRCKQTNIQQK